MNFKTTGLLVGLLLIVGAVWLFYPEDLSLKVEEPEPRGPEALKDIFDPRPEVDEVVRVEVVRAGEPPMIFERDPSDAAPGGADSWRMTAPLAAPVEGYKVQGLVRAVVGLQSRDSFEPGAAGRLTADDAGLDPPVATITLVDRAGEKTVLEVGDKAVMSSDTYVRLAGQKTIYLAARDLQPQIKNKVSDYRAKRLTSLKQDEVTHLRIRHEGRTYDLSRGDDDQWVINEPLHAYADAAKVREKLLGPLGRLRAEEFVDDESESPAAYGLDQPLLVFDITTETRRELPREENEEEGQDEEEEPSEPPAPEFETITTTHNVTIGGFADLKSEHRYVKTDAGPWIATVKQSDVEPLIPNFDELRDPRITRLKAGDVTRLELTIGYESATVSRVDGVWQGTGDLAMLDSDAIVELLTALEELRATGFVDQPEAPAQYGLELPRAVLTVTARGLVTPLTLRIGGLTASGRNAYVQREGDPTVYVTTAAQADRLAIDPLALRARQIFKFPREQLRQVVVERDSQRFVMIGTDDDWKLTEPADARIDVGDARKLRTDLSSLRARKVVAKGDMSAFGLDQPPVRIAFDIEPPAATTQEAEAAAEVETVEHALRVAEKDGTIYAAKDDESYIFELDKSVYDSLTAGLIDPKLFTFAPEDIVRIKVAATGGTLELAKSGDEWEYVPDPFVALDQKKVEEFARDIANIRVESWLAYSGGNLDAHGLLAAPASMTIGLADGGEATMAMTQEQPGTLPGLAALVSERRIFRLRQPICQKLLRGLDDYVAADKPQP